jgi:hypothetical protein
VQKLLHLGLTGLKDWQLKAAILEGYCGRNCKFSSTNPPVLNNHSNDFKSHLHSHPARFRRTLAGCRGRKTFPLPAPFPVASQSSAGTEWCSCVMVHRPSILHRPIVRRKSNG